MTFFTTMFLQLVPSMRTPQLREGMGRAANNVCAFTISGASVALTQASVVAAMIASIVLFMLTIAAFVGAGLPYEHLQENRYTNVRWVYEEIHGEIDSIRHEEPHPPPYETYSPKGGTMGVVWKAAQRATVATFAERGTFHG